MTALHSNSIPWSEVHPETLGVWQIGRDSSLNLAASSVLIFSLTGHCSPENPEAKACVFATGCFSVTETPSGMSEASSSVRTICFCQPFTSPPPITTRVELRSMYHFTVISLIFDGHRIQE